MVLDADGWEMVVALPPEERTDPLIDTTVRRLATCALRPSVLWGGGDPHFRARLLTAARRNRLWRIGTGENQVSMTHVENAADAHIQAADTLAASTSAGGRAFFITDPEPVNVWQWIGDVLQHHELSPPTRSIPVRSAAFAATVLEGIYRQVGISRRPPLTRFLVNQLGRTHTYTSDAARAAFGYAPDTYKPG